MCGGNGNTGKPVKITLEVNADELYKLNPQPLTNNQGELDAYCGLADDNLGKVPPGLTLNDYTTDVYAGNTVTWSGMSAGEGSNGYRVLIDSITTKTPAFFKSDPPGKDGRVTATLADNINGVEDTYTINFTIDPPGNGSPRSYSLDPKLKGNA